MSETYQVGFRVAQQAGIERLICFDNKTVHWQAKPLFDYVAEHDPKMQQAFNEKIAEITKTQNDMHATMTLQEILKTHNDKRYDDINRGLYIWTNAVGVEANYVGAAASASWWHRNFNMYANIQQAAQPGERVFVIAGQGHTAVFKDFLSVEYDRTKTDINQYL